MSLPMPEVIHVRITFGFNRHRKVEIQLGIYPFSLISPHPLLQYSADFPSENDQRINVVFCYTQLSGADSACGVKMIMKVVDFPL